ncbi:MAG: class I SAM-dependent methyltransferase [Herpetosiphonaceae bacterium]|nr:class I SAM-dependent methyltransferase [Herpetosiphonaceae bacterium]
MQINQLIEDYGRTMPPEAKPAYFRLHRYRFRDLLRALPAAPARILEIGTTPGTFTGILRRAGYEVAGIDLFPEGRAALWQELGVEVMFCNLDEQPIPYADESFDAVVFSEVIEHLAGSPLRPLREMARVLRPGGRIVISTPNQFYFKSRMKMLGDVVLNRPFESFSAFTHSMQLDGPQRYYNHSRLYTMPELRWMLEQAGLKVALEHFGDAWERVGIERRRVFQHPLRVGTKAALWVLTALRPRWRSMLLIVGMKAKA